MESNPKNHYLIPLGLAVAMALGLWLGYKMAPHTNGVTAEKRGEKYQKIQDILEVLDKRYVDPVDGEEIFEKTISDMLHQLDPHSSYISARDMKAANENIEGKFGGVGVRFFVIRDTVCITNVVPGSPAEVAGVKAGDKFIEVDGEKIAGVKIANDKVMDYLKGEPSTDVEVKVLRGKETLEVTIKRGEIPIQSVTSYYMIDETAGFIRIESFSVTTANEFKRAGLTLLQQGMTKLVLDLRNNSGGVLRSAVEIADDFLPGGMTIVQTKGVNVRNEHEKSRDGGILERVELAVLINQNSASATEILAGALQDNDRATIYGRRSFGKGLVMQDFYLSDSSNLRLTISRYYTPSGRCIQKPYNGSMEDYYRESYDRYDNGELFAPDSSLFVDSLKFKTRKGKTVYGGGGIMPDVFIPFDTSDFTNYFTQLRFTGALQEFAFDFVSDKRNQWDGVEAYKADFKVKFSLIKELSKFAEQYHDLSVGFKELMTNQKVLEKYLKAEIARQLWVEQGYFAVMNEYDPEIKVILDSWE